MSEIRNVMVRDGAFGSESRLEKVQWVQRACWVPCDGWHGTMHWVQRTRDARRAMAKICSCKAWKSSVS